MTQGLLTHEFDSSRTCNYCGVAEERTPSKGAGLGDPCPVRQAGKKTGATMTHEPMPEDRLTTLEQRAFSSLSGYAHDVNITLYVYGQDVTELCREVRRLKEELKRTRGTSGG